MNFGNLYMSEVVLKFLKKFFACFLVLGLLTRPVPAFVWNSTSRDWRTKDRISKVLSPEFEETNTRVIAVAGHDAILPCRVANLNDKVVSWIRTRDLHILTSGSVVFTADDRFESRNVKGSSDWSLRLSKTQVSDAGVYECQVNTDPKMNRKVTLDVVSTPKSIGDPSSNDIDLYMVEDEGFSPNKESMTRILGEEEQYVKTGSTITFTCLVIIPGETVTSIDWLKNGKLISFQASRGGIIVETEKSEKKATSRLTLADVKPKDSGNYTCKPLNAKSHSIGLVVIEGERTEAMQRNSNGTERIQKNGILNFVCIILTLLFRYY